MTDELVRRGHNESNPALPEVAAAPASRCEDHFAGWEAVGTGSTFLNSPMRLEDGHDALLERCSGNQVSFRSTITENVREPADKPADIP